MGTRTGSSLRNQPLATCYRLVPAHGHTAHISTLSRRVGLCWIQDATQTIHIHNHHTAHRETVPLLAESDSSRNQPRGLGFIACAGCMGFDSLGPLYAPPRGCLSLEPAQKPNAKMIIATRNPIEKPFTKSATGSPAPCSPAQLWGFRTARYALNRSTATHRNLTDPGFSGPVPSLLADPPTGRNSRSGG